MVEPSARFEEVQIPLDEPVDGVETVSGVLGVPEWWPTGSRVGVVLAHASGRSMQDPLVEEHPARADRAEVSDAALQLPLCGGREERVPIRCPCSSARSVTRWRCCSRDPSAAPAHLFVGGIGLGAQVAVQAAATRMRVDGVFVLGYPLHAHDEPTEHVRAERAVPAGRADPVRPGRARPPLRSRHAAPHAHPRRRAEDAARDSRSGQHARRAAPLGPADRGRASGGARSVDIWMRSVLGA